MITRFHNGSWWAYSPEFDSDTGPYSTEEQAQDFIDNSRWRGREMRTQRETDLEEEIERLTADLNESERQTRAQLKRVLQRDERITKLEGDLLDAKEEYVQRQEWAAEQTMAVNKELKERITKLEAAAKKTISEFIDEDADHSAACMNWALCEHSQHQCGLCDLREALANSEGEK